MAHMSLKEGREWIRRVIVESAQAQKVLIFRMIKLLLLKRKDQEIRKGYLKNETR